MRFVLGFGNLTFLWAAGLFGVANLFDKVEGWDAAIRDPDQEQAR